MAIASITTIAIVAVRKVRVYVQAAVARKGIIVWQYGNIAMSNIHHGTIFIWYSVLEYQWYTCT